jgi:hypothetical protein
MPLKIIKYLCLQKKRYVVLHIHSLLWSTRSADFVIENQKRRELTYSKHLKREGMRSRGNETWRYNPVWNSSLWGSVEINVNGKHCRSVCVYVVDTIWSITNSFFSLRVYSDRSLDNQSINFFCSIKNLIVVDCWSVLQFPRAGTGNNRCLYRLWFYCRLGNLLSGFITLHSLQTFELHMQPLPHFIRNTNFTLQQPTALCNFNNFNIL